MLPKMSQEKINVGTCLYNYSVIHQTTHSVSSNYFYLINRQVLKEKVIFFNRRN